MNILPMDCKVVKRMEMKSAYPDLTVLKNGESLLSYHLALLARASSHRHSPEVKSCLQSASRIPLPEPTPPLESGNKEATLIGSWHRFDTTHEGVSAVMPGAACFSDESEFYSISQRWPAWDRHEGVPKQHNFYFIIISKNPLY